MECTALNDTFSVTGQITIDDMPAIAALGFKTIICHRPDNEGGDTQPLSNVLKQHAEGQGMQFVHIPFSPGLLTPEDVARFKAVFVQCEKPVLGFCKTGNRAKTIYAAANIT